MRAKNPRARRTDAWKSAGLSHLFLGLGALAVAVYFVVGSFAQMLVWDAIGYSAVVVIVAATRLRRPPTASAWYLFAAGVFANVTGDAINNAYLEISSREIPVPYYSDIFYLSSYVLLAAGTVGFARQLRRALSLPDLIDASVYATGVALLAWGPVFDAQIHEAGLTALGHAVLLMYPAGDILVLAAFGLFLAVGGWRQAWIRLLGVGLVSFLVADVLYSASFASFSSGSAVDAGWLCAYVLFGAAALRTGELTTGADRGLLRHAAWRRAGLVAATVAAIGLIFYDVAVGESLSWGEAGLATILIGLVVLRLVLGMQEFERAHETELAARHAIERSRAELAETEARFRALTERGFDLVTIQDADRVFRYVSPSVERMLGHTPPELLGRDALELVHPDDRETLADSVESGLLGPERSETREMRLRRKDGSWCVVEAIGVNLLDNPAVRGVVTTSRDVTDRAGAREELQASEQRFRNVAAQLFDIVMIVDPEGIVSYVNDALTRVLGYAPEEYIGSSGLENIHPDDVLLVARTLAEGIPTPGTVETVEFRARHRDGSWRLLEATGQNLVDHPAIRGVLVTSRDITEQRRVDAALRESEEWFRLLAESSPDVIFRRSVSPAG
ncbi:MAG TPA: PAS domain S-box protein, partial [Gaiellaceae bacterium]|nr:PAS domain S-box protein [Gaiellaceae bacterium]